MFSNKTFSNNFFLRNIEDSIKKTTDTLHSPKKAAIYSTILPGLGQGYNKKYYKIPIIYGGLGVLGYLAIDYHKKFVLYRNGYLTTVDSIVGNEIFKDSIVYPSTRLFSEQEIFRNRRDIFILGFVLFYAANIIDAVVDAHLYSFDVSDNLSLKIKPMICPMISPLYTKVLNNNGGNIQWLSSVTLQFNWHKANQKNKLLHLNI